MKSIFVIFFATICIFSLSLRADEEILPKEVKIGFNPSGNGRIMEAAAQKICDELGHELGVKVTPLVPETYSQLSDLINHGQVDFAFMTSREFVENEKKSGVKVLLKKVWEEPYYYSILLSLKGSKIKKLSDLKGKKLAFVDKNSTSGYLYPEVEFHKRGIKDSSFKEILFSGSHSKSVILLEQKDVDAIAVFSDDKDGKASAWQKFRTEDKLQTQKIWSSDPIPNDPFCVRAQFYEQHPKLTHSLMFAMIDATEKLKSDPDVKFVMGAKGFMPATTRQYDSVREMIRVLKLGEEK